MVVTEVRRYMEAAVEKLSPARAQEMARSLLKGQGKGKEQVQKVAQDLMDWSNQTRERMTEMIRREVARQLKAMGVATKDDLEALKARVRVLERGAGSAAAAAKSPAKRSGSSTRAASAKAAAGKPAAAKTPTARRSSGAASDKGGS
jgi:polyhydroxyalkanoate synthesis regulator phasin